MADKFLVAPFKSGLRDDQAPFLLPEDAYTRLNNAYILRGRLKKRFGSVLTGSTASSLEYRNLSSRLRVKLGVTDQGGDLTVSTIIQPAVGQMYSVGTALYTTNVAGSPIAVLLETVATLTATVNFTTKQLILVGAPANEDVYLYPTVPVLGFENYEKGPVNDHTTFAFDKFFAYKYDGDSWDRNGAVLFKGGNDDLFWTTNWVGVTNDNIAMFVTNFNVTDTGAPAATDDPMYYYDGTTWTNFSTPTIFNAAGHYVASASMIASFKNRLLLFDTVERQGAVNVRYSNKIRYCHYGSPLAANAWLEPNQSHGGNDASGGGFLFSPTEEEFVSISMIKDRLIVFCERSTWELLSTGNPDIPFVWESINQELGSEAKFSNVLFDRNVITIGSTSINSCDGAYVNRIDEEIPNKVFQILKTTEGTRRIVGTRDYYNEMVYWSFLKQDHADENNFNDSLIMYNYTSGSWAFADDCITAFGSLEKEKKITEANAKQLVCGNQQGFVFVTDSTVGSNSQAMIITDMSYADPEITLTVYDHNIRTDDFVKIEYPQGITTFSDGIYKATREDEDNIKITASFLGTYTGGGLISRVSRIEADTKDMNPYISEGNNVSLIKVDFNVDKTVSGEITVDYSTSSSTLSMVDEGEITGAIVGNSILETSPYMSGAVYLEPSEQYQNQLWHTVHLNASGNNVKLRFILKDAQMTDEDIAESMFTLNGMILYTEMDGKR